MFIHPVKTRVISSLQGTVGRRLVVLSLTKNSCLVFSFTSCRGPRHLRFYEESLYRYDFNTSLFEGVGTTS
jgi:hypothetical protein